MKETRCILCNSVKIKRINNYYFQCAECGFVFVVKSPQAPESIYEEKYFHIEDFGGRRKIGYRSYEKDKSHHKYYFGKKIDLIKNFLPNGKILDIGCALGFFMGEALERGYEPYGIDISEYATSHALKKFPNKVFCGELIKAKFKAEFFDAVTLFQTIEHIENPLITVKEARRILKKGGFLFIATPNRNCWMQKIMGNKWFEYKPEEHLNIFDKETIKYFLEKNGFKIINFYNDVFYYPLNYIAERVAYYTPFKFLSKISFANNFRIPLPLGGMFVVSQKK